MIFAGPGMVRATPGGRDSTPAALGAAAGVAIAGAVTWGLIALATHKQLSLIGLAIGAGVGALVARFRPGHLPTIIAGAVIAVAGCALGTLLGQIFLLLDAHVSLPVILRNLSQVFRAYPRNVGMLGVLFYALAAYAAVRVPLRDKRLAARAAAAGAAGVRPRPASDPAADPAPESDSER